MLENILGNGLLVAEGNIQKKQKRIIQPAFSIPAIRELTPIFFSHANAFVKKLDGLLNKTKGPSDIPFIEGQNAYCSRLSLKNRPAFDIFHWFGRLTLDIIGEAARWEFWISFYSTSNKQDFFNGLQSSQPIVAKRSRMQKPL